MGVGCSTDTVLYGIRRASDFQVSRTKHYIGPEILNWTLVQQRKCLPVRAPAHPRFRRLFERFYCEPGRAKAKPDFDEAKLEPDFLHDFLSQRPDEIFADRGGASRIFSNNDARFIHRSWKQTGNSLSLMEFASQFRPKGCVSTVQNVIKGRPR